MLSGVGLVGRSDFLKVGVYEGEGSMDCHRDFSDEVKY